MSSKQSSPGRGRDNLEARNRHAVQSNSRKDAGPYRLRRIHHESSKNSSESKTHELTPVGSEYSRKRRLKVQDTTRVQEYLCDTRGNRDRRVASVEQGIHKLANACPEVAQKVCTNCFTSDVYIVMWSCNGSNLRIRRVEDVDGSLLLQDDFPFTNRLIFYWPVEQISESLRHSSMLRVITLSITASTSFSMSRARCRGTQMTACCLSLQQRKRSWF
ncbi:hypothetical protein KCU78_g13, partial [Aureobasidium melanogenum]